MKLKRLAVRRMPGFEDRGFVLEDLSEGLNLIVGPNASGKTTICRAIRALLWPRTLGGSAPVSLVGEWRQDQSDIRMELEGDRRDCQTDGQPCEPPAVPGSHLAECFTVTVGSLIRATRADAALADNVMRQMAGGYDVEAVLREFAVSTRHGQPELRNRIDAQQKVRAIQQQHRALQDEEALLEELGRQESESRQARARLARLADVRQLLDVRSELAEKNRSLRDLPAGMDRLNGGEGTALQQLKGDLDTELKRLESAEGQAGEAKRQKDDTVLPHAGIDPGLLRQQQARLEQLRDAQQRIERIREDIARAENRLNQSLGRLGKTVQAEKLDRIDLGGLDSVESLHRQWQQLDARRAAVEERLAALGPEQPAEQTAALAEAIGILRQWFEATAEGRSAAGRDRFVAWILAGILVVTGAVLAVLVDPWSLAAAAAGVAGAIVLWVIRRPAAGNGREAFRRRYERLELEPPARWNPETVGRHLNQLEQRLAAARSLEQLQSERRNRQAELDQLKGRLEDLGLRRKSLAQRLGVDLQASELSLVTFAQDLLRYRQAADELAGLQGQLEQTAARRDEHLEAINGFLALFGVESCDRYEIARVGIDKVAERAERFRDADARLDAARRQMAAARNRIDELSERRRAFFENLALNDEDESSLLERLERLPQYRQLHSRLTELNGLEAALLDRLADAADLQQLNRSELEAESSRLRALADRHQELVDRIAGIRAKVDQARSQNNLEDALAGLDEATGRLARKRDEAVEAAAGTLLLELVKQEQQVEHQPAVFRSARKWLSLFTAGRYDLRIGSDKGRKAAFLAYDNTQRRSLELGQLSGGTRMQLLLAVRLAFAADSERGAELPFILDEALSGTDPVRFRAIVECMAAIIRRGRQVFYLTCQPGDALAWRQVMQEAGLDGVELIDLAKVRQIEQPAGNLLGTSSAARDAVPAPQGRTLSEYASLLEVAAFDPAAGAAGLHVAYLVDDPEDLYGLLRCGIRTYGQLKSLLEHGPTDAYLRPEAAERAAARAAVVQAVSDCWKVGRGRPLNREALCDAGVSDNFIDRVTDLARELDWDGRRLVEALQTREDERARGFRTNALEFMVEQLAAAGYLDTRKPLAESEALVRVLASANDAVRACRIEADEVRRLFRLFWPAG